MFFGFVIYLRWYRFCSFLRRVEESRLFRPLLSTVLATLCCWSGVYQCKNVQLPTEEPLAQIPSSVTNETQICVQILTDSVELTPLPPPPDLIA